MSAPQVGELAFTQGERAFYEEVLRDGLEARRALTEHEEDLTGADAKPEAEGDTVDGGRPRSALSSIWPLVERMVAHDALAPRAFVSICPSPLLITQCAADSVLKASQASRESHRDGT